MVASFRIRDRSSDSRAVDYCIGEGEKVDPGQTSALAQKDLSVVRRHSNLQQGRGKLLGKKKLKSAKPQPQLTKSALAQHAHATAGRMDNTSRPTTSGTAASSSSFDSFMCDPFRPASAHGPVFSSFSVIFNRKMPFFRAFQQEMKGKNPAGAPLPWGH